MASLTRDQIGLPGSTLCWKLGFGLASVELAIKLMDFWPLGILVYLFLFTQGPNSYHQSLFTRYQSATKCDKCDELPTTPVTFLPNTNPSQIVASVATIFKISSCSKTLLQLVGGQSDRIRNWSKVIPKLIDCKVDEFFGQIEASWSNSMSFGVKSRQTDLTPHWTFLVQMKKAVDWLVGEKDDGSRCSG